MVTPARITEERLANILSNPQAVAYFQTLDVDVTESAALFHLIDNGDGEASICFTQGALLQHAQRCSPAAAA